MHENTSSLSDIVEANEILKHIAKISAAINIDAMNAILLARRADKGQRNGFAVVATEMRTFSGRLNLVSQELQKEIRRLLPLVAAQQKRDHITRIYTAIRNQQIEIVQNLFTKINAQYKKDQEIAERIGDIIRNRGKNALRLCDNSAALYRNARVEIAYLQAYHQELLLVAERIEDVMTTAVRLLKRLLKLKSF